MPCEEIPMSVAAFIANRLPSTQDQVPCPACGFSFQEVQYRTTRLTRGNGGDTLDTTSFGEYDSHLRVVCGCGFWWERAVVHA